MNTKDVENQPERSKLKKHKKSGPPDLKILRPVHPLSWAASISHTSLSASLSVLVSSGNIPSSTWTSIFP
jgi:hypothetical protein